MAIPAWLEGASAAGQAIGGIATVVGVTFAIAQVSDWRKRIRGEAAGKVYDAVVRCTNMTVARVTWLMLMTATKPTKELAAKELALQLLDTANQTYIDFMKSIDEVILAYSQAGARLAPDEVLPAIQFTDKARALGEKANAYAMSLTEDWTAQNVEQAHQELHNIDLKSLASAQLDVHNVLRAIILGEANR